MSHPAVQTNNGAITLFGLPEFEGKTVRKTNTIPPKVSVYDLISVIVDKSNPRQCFERMKQACPDITSGDNWKFPGARQRDTPVVDAKGAVRIINLLPGKKAAIFRTHFADIIVRVLGGDVTLIQDIERNADIQQTLPEEHPMRLFGQDIEARVPCLLSAGYDKQVLGNQVYFGLPGPRLIKDTEDDGILVKLGFTKKGKEKRRYQDHVSEYGGFDILDCISCHHPEALEEQLKHTMAIKKRKVCGKVENKQYRDTELILVKDQEDYDDIIGLAKTLAENIDSKQESMLELSLAKETTLQMEKQIVIEELKTKQAIELTKQMEFKYEIEQFRSRVENSYEHEDEDEK